MPSGGLEIALTFLLALVVAVVFYLIGGLLAPKGEKTSGKLSSYACGEDLRPIRPRLNVGRFFVYLVLFLAFDVAVFLTAASMRRPGLYPALYLVISLLAVALLPHVGEA
ncbi:hypothetical protein DRO02_08820 [archaeon]|nr:MAG: hypothetical protein DRO02_08820 [archaeon]